MKKSSFESVLQDIKELELKIGNLPKLTESQKAQLESKLVQIIKNIYS